MLARLHGVYMRVPMPNARCSDTIDTNTQKHDMWCSSHIVFVLRACVCRACQRTHARVRNVTRLFLSVFLYMSKLYRLCVASLWHRTRGKPRCRRNEMASCVYTSVSPPCLAMSLVFDDDAMCTLLLVCFALPFGRVNTDVSSCRLCLCMFIYFSVRGERMFCAASERYTAQTVCLSHVSGSSILSFPYLSSYYIYIMCSYIYLFMYI